MEEIKIAAEVVSGLCGYWWGGAFVMAKLHKNLAPREHDFWDDPGFPFMSVIWPIVLVAVGPAMMAGKIYKAVGGEENKQRKRQW